jgi:hypothetical protein
MVEASEDLQAAGQVLNLFVDPSIPGSAPFDVVKEKAFSMLDAERFSLVSDYMCNIEFDKTGFERSSYARLSPAFKRNLRHLFSELDFAGRVEDAPLLEAVAFLQGLLREGKSPRQTKPSLFPIDVIPKSLQRYLFTGVKTKVKTLEVDRYEFLIYRLLRQFICRLYQTRPSRRTPTQSRYPARSTRPVASSSKSPYLLATTPFQSFP